ncbi:MAG: tRNA (guanine(10)-N(2))-dimethyltransferase [Desulfurococcales archaeon]|nr:tRNA (guanine(10)-N(2))-dimethyltransferase [Desulfurococcales archaeon]
MSRLGQAVVREGRALIHVDGIEEAYAGGRLEPAWMPVFYNPAMILNRDVSVAAIQAYIDEYAPHRPVNIVEPLTATGVRSVRYALELRGVGRVIAGDIDPRAVELARVNAEANGVDVEVVGGDARCILYSLRGTPVLVVDIDPFGSPAPFMEAALTAIGRGGMLAVTATDLAVLEGSKQRAALRRYMARLERIPHSKEVAVRALIGYIARVAAGLDKAVEPLLSYYQGHYVRLYLRVERGARRADLMLEKHLGYLYYCPGDGTAWLGEPGCDSPRRLGPLWVGSLWDPRFVELTLREVEARAYLQSRREALRLLGIVRGEAGLGVVVHQRIDSIASSLRVSMPRRRAVLEELSRMGYRAVETHFSPVGVRSDADPGVVAGVVRRLSGGS